MQRHGIRADMYSINSILALLSRAGAVHAALHAFDQLRAMNAPIDAFTYSAVLSACARCEPTRPADAERLLWQATRDGVRWAPAMVNATLSAFGSKISEALRCWKEIRANAQPSDESAARSIQAYEALMRVCGRAARADMALKIVYAVRKSNDLPAVRGTNLFNAFKRGVREGGAEQKLQCIPAQWYVQHLETECRAFDIDFPIERIRIKY